MVQRVLAAGAEVSDRGVKESLVYMRAARQLRTTRLKALKHKQQQFICNLKVPGIDISSSPVKDHYF